VKGEQQLIRVMIVGDYTHLVCDKHQVIHTYILAHVISINLWGGHHDYSHFIDVETKTQRGKETLIVGLVSEIILTTTLNKLFTY
jgi:hypothetical protein